ncbi:MAG: hypothetical protein QMD99_11385 [Rhizobiaceae bacterium]|nr:hypothetical protein [Rhizobiaceae bacterium]
MKNIKFPWMRAQLISFIRGLSDFNYQKRNWQIYRPDQERYDELDYTIHFFYDDTSLAADPSSLIGDILCDDREVLEMRSIVSAIDLVFEKYGLELKDAEYLAKPEWIRVVEAASNALPIFEANGVGSFE